MVSPQRPESGRRRVITGVAVSFTSVTAADLRLKGSDNAWSASLEPPQSETSWPSLTQALTQLAQALGVTGGDLAVSLLPPLTELRQLELPPASDEDMYRLLSRNASRYFVNARGPQVVGALVTDRRKRGRPVRMVAAAAAQRLVMTVRAAAASAGWTVTSIAPAESAWAGAAVALWPSFARQHAWMIVAHEDHTDLLELESGRLTGVRRFRYGGGDAALIADALGPTARVGVAGETEARRHLTSALAARAVEVSTAVGSLASKAARADLLAAVFAGTPAGPVLRSDDTMAQDRERSRHTVRTLLTIAAVLVVMAGGIELWGVKHQLAQVREARARIAPQIASTMMGRGSVEASYRHLSQLGDVERTAPHWSSVIVSLTEALPADAYLTALRARDDSLIVDGLAKHAARVFDALAEVPALTGVKAPAPVRREVQDDGAALDHFTIAARLRVPVVSLAPQPVARPVVPKVTP